MNDPWRFVAFPVAAIVGYLLSLGVSTQFANVTGLGDLSASLAVVAISGFLAGFMVDEVIPAYLEKVVDGGRGGGFGGGGGSSFGGGGDSGGFDDDDLNFE